MRLVATVIAVIALGAASSIAAAGTSALFIGNSFTYGWGSPVRFYRAHTVTDLNGEGIGGVPALFKIFTVQAGLEYDVNWKREAAAAWTSTSRTSAISSGRGRGTSS